MPPEEITDPKCLAVELSSMMEWHHLPPRLKVGVCPPVPRITAFLLPRQQAYDVKCEYLKHLYALQPNCPIGVIVIDDVAVHHARIRGWSCSDPSFHALGIWFSAALKHLIDEGVVGLTAHEQAVMARHGDQRSNQTNGRELRSRRAASREDAIAATGVGWTSVQDDDWPLKRRFAPRG